MADVKVIVKQMKSAGMTEQEILANLQELGIENPEEKVATVLKELESEKPSGEENSLRITKIEGEKERTVDIGGIIESGEKTQGELMKKVAASDISNADDIEDKLDQVIALLKALQEVNKKILETNRDVLVKLNKAQESGEKPTLGKIF